jgi:hypothetical protein
MLTREGIGLLRLTVCHILAPLTKIDTLGIIPGEIDTLGLVIILWLSDVVFIVLTFLLK